MTNQTHELKQLFNPFTGEPIPPVPDCVSIYDWDFHFDDAEDVYFICNYSETPLNLAASFIIHRDGTVRTDVVTCNDALADLDQLEQEAKLLPVWLKQVRAMRQWVFARFH